MLSEAAVDRYLRLIGVPDPGSPSPAGLAALHRAHVLRVPYEALDIHLGRSRSIDPLESAELILGGRGGYCFHLNGAFGALLTALGYRVRRHVAGVHTQRDPEPPGATGNHLALTVEFDGEEANDGTGGRWYVDVGLGDGFLEPLPLRTGVHHQAGSEYRLSPSPTVPGGWRFDHDPTNGSFIGVDFAAEEAGPADFHAEHRRLWTSPDSPFAQVVAVFRPTAEGCDALRGLMLSRRGPAGTETRELTSATEWYGALADVFDLRLPDVGRADRAALWERVTASHRAWLRTEADRPEADRADTARAETARQPG